MSLLSSPGRYTSLSTQMLPAQGPVRPPALTRHLKLLSIPQWGFTGALCTESGNISPALIQHHCNISQPARWYLVLGTWQRPGHPLFPCAGAPGSPKHPPSGVSPRHTPWLALSQGRGAGTPFQGCSVRLPSSASASPGQFPSSVSPATTGGDVKSSAQFTLTGLAGMSAPLPFIYPSFVTTKYKR